jgi:hypothetical protein
MRIPGRQRQTSLGADLLEGRSRFPKTSRGGHSQSLQGLLNLRVRSKTHLLPSYAYEGIPLPLTVRRYLRRKKLPGRIGERPTLSLGVLRSAFAGRRPHLQGNHISMWGRSRMWGRRGRQSCPLFHLSLAGGCRSRRGPHPSPFHCQSGNVLISLSLSSHAHVSSLEACLASGLMTTMGGSASYDSPRLPPRPCLRSQVQ